MSRRGVWNPGDLNMEPANFKSTSIDELWAWHIEITTVLARKISLEKKQLEQRLQKLHLGASEGTARRERRPYPRVFPKYRNPDNPSETWAGRGKQPRWLTAQLGTGRTLDDFRIQKADFRIQKASDRKRRSTWR
jgi:DNA-binding protein H-NS